MDLSVFRTRVRQRLTDLDSTPRFTDSMIDNMIDDWVRDTWTEIVRKFPPFYRTRITRTAITDAVASSNDELYLLPNTTDDTYKFRALGTLRRSDLIDNPLVSYVRNEDHEYYRFFIEPLLYNPDSSVPTTTGEYWSVYDATRFKILPSPQSNTYTYEMTYFRWHTTATLDADDIDIPDEFLTRAINEVAYLLSLIDDDESHAEKLKKLVEISRQQTQTVGQQISSGTIPKVRR